MIQKKLICNKISKAARLLSSSKIIINHNTYFGSYLAKICHVVTQYNIVYPKKRNLNWLTVIKNETDEFHNTVKKINSPVQFDRHSFKRDAYFLSALFANLFKTNPVTQLVPNNKELRSYHLYQER